MKLMFIKLIVVTISIVSRFFFGLLPLIIFSSVTKNVSGGIHSTTMKYWISILMFFGGGVLLATSFVHMMPEVRETFATQRLSTVVPIAELIFIVGFFLVYLLEEIVHGFVHYRHHKNKEMDSCNTPSTEEADVEAHTHVPRGIREEEESFAGALRNLLIVVAISFHGVFEGLAIGLQGTASDVWQLFLGVSLHECTILFCIGVELVSSQTKLIRMISYISCVSLVSPVGILIGVGISQNPVSITGASVPQTLLVASLQGIAAGTLLYVAFFEIFVAEGRKLHNKFVHIFIAILGFFLVVCFQILGE